MQLNFFSLKMLLFKSFFMYLMWINNSHLYFSSEMKLDSAATSSLEDRVKRNIYSIQRTAASLDNFMKRWRLSHHLHGLTWHKWLGESVPTISFCVAVIIMRPIYFVEMDSSNPDWTSMTLNRDYVSPFLNMTFLLRSIFQIMARQLIFHSNARGSLWQFIFHPISTLYSK